MQRQCVKCVALVWAVAVLAAWADQPPKNELPETLPDEIVKAWQEAGADYLWVRPTSTGYRRLPGTEERKAGDLPAFHFSRWKEGMLAKVPDPARPFALNLDGTGMTDVGLKELRRLKSL